MRTCRVSAHTVTYVTIIDVNDRMPQFTEELYNLAVSEGMSVGEIVHVGFDIIVQAIIPIHCNTN